LLAPRILGKLGGGLEQVLSELARLVVLDRRFVAFSLVPVMRFVTRCVLCSVLKNLVSRLSPLLNEKCAMHILKIEYLNLHFRCITTTDIIQVIDL
jgi:hypothetical protein